MRRFLSGLCASSLALSFAVASLAPVNAATLFVPQTIDQASDIQNVQFRLRGDRYDGRRVIRRGDNFYLNGHRGIGYYRPGYRRYGDFWFPAAAFLVGALITGAIVDGSRSGSAHVQWCYDRYRSYRAWDNTFQPYDGPRRQCYSPYD